jgi:hypothetical protein
VSVEWIDPTLVNWQCMEKRFLDTSELAVTGMKAGPRWQHVVWLGKTMLGDQHIVGTAAGVFTRSIGRSPNPFNLDRLGDLES